MPENLSYLSVAASGFYLIVAAACIAASYAASQANQPYRHLLTWSAVAALFALLMIMRGFGFEDWLRDSGRDWLRSDGRYAGRRDLQAVLVSVTLVAFGASSFWWLYNIAGKLRGRRDVALLVALVSSGAMLFLVLLRLVSLHAVDRFLYGPIKLNWVVDIGSSLAVLAAATFYVWLVRPRP